MTTNSSGLNYKDQNANCRTEAYQQNTLEVAKKYLNNHLSIFPIPKPQAKSKQGDLEYDGKTPIIKWTQFQYRQAEIREIEDWFSTDENNIAIVTGLISSIFVIDIDGQKSKQLFQSQVLPKLSPNLQDAMEKTMHVRTGGGGAHIYLEFELEDFPDGIISKKSIVLGEHDEISIKGNGGYVIAPPSIHVSGTQYEVLAKNLAILSKDQVRELLYALDSLSESNTFEAHSLSRDKEILLELNTIRTQRIAELVRSCYLKGNRDEIIFALSGYLHRRLVSKQSALDVVKQLIDDDEEKSSRLKVVENTYKRPRDSIEVSGYKRLLEALTA